MKERVWRMERKYEPQSDWRIAFWITATLRVLYSAAGALAAVFVHPDPALIRSNVLTANLPTPAGWHDAIIGVWERFDTLWYLRIAARGYDLPAAVVFYPLYPWLIRWMGGAVGPIAAALLISTLAAFFYFWGLLRLARNEFANAGSVKTSSPLRTVMLAAVWPASFFLFVGYTEALAMALIVWCIVWARDDRWWLATACAFAAGMTRSAGTLTVVPLVMLALRSRNLSRWLVALSPLGTLGYWLWLHQTGRLSVADAYRVYWKTQVAAPWTTLWAAIYSLVGQFDPLVVISLIALVFFFITGVIARRRLEDRCFSAAVIGHLLLRLCWPPLLGAPRYLLPIYPAFLTMGRSAAVIQRRRFIFLCGALFALNLVWMWAFLSWSLIL